MKLCSMYLPFIILSLRTTLGYLSARQWHSGTHLFSQQSIKHNNYIVVDEVDYVCSVSVSFRMKKELLYVTY